MNNNANNRDLELLRIVAIGSVDDGKSTLIGRLLHDTGLIYRDHLEALPKSDTSPEEVDLAFLTDGLMAEQEQGITIDVAYRYMAASKRRIIIADVPGHEQYTRNMVTGASTAHLALLLIDARKGLLEQSKRHLFISSLLGIPHILIAINKMDLVDYDEQVFQDICRDVIDFAKKLKIRDLQFIPVSALKGDMVVSRGDKLDWYTGRTILIYLETLEVTGDLNLIDFRLPIQLVLRPNQDYRGYAGTIEGGSVKVGEEVTILPSKETTRIKSISVGGEKRKYAFTPQSVVVTFDDEIDASRGEVIARTNNIPHTANVFEAFICWMDSVRLETKQTYILKHCYKSTRCTISTLEYKLNVNTLHRQKNTKTLKFNEIGRVQIETSSPIFFDSYEQNRNMGNFILVDEATNHTVAAGMILPKLHSKGSSLSQKPPQKGGVIWFTGLSGSGKTTIADRVFKELKKRNIPCERLDGDILRDSVTSHLGFSKKDRELNVNIAGFLAERLAAHGVIVLATFISPYRKDREQLKERIGNFTEIYVNAPLEVCRSRDVKGLYKQVQEGQITSFTGVDSPYEPPESPDLEIQTDQDSLDDSVSLFMEWFEKKNFSGN